MMKKIIHSLYLSATVFLISCGNNSTDKSDLSTDIQQINFNKADSVTGNTASAVPAAAAGAPASVLPAANSGRPLVNPPHGQPFHDCSIDVGKPLPAVSASTLPATGSPISPIAPAPLNSNPILSSAVPAPAAAVQPTGVKPLLNPAHGQPWHDCSIAEGQPLKSSASKISATPTLPTPIAAPSLQATTANTPKPKLNPAHGQPWHRCDISVGEPIDKPAANATPSPAITLKNDTIKKS